MPPPPARTYATTVSLPLKASDRADQCPEADWCQLEVDYNETASLDVIDGPAAGVKLVQVGMQQLGQGCDALVRVGVVRSGGPIAFGVRYVRVVTSKVYFTVRLTGEIIDSKTFVSEYPATRSTPPAETVVSSVDVGDFTWLTQTSEQIEERHWEVALDGCVHREPFLAGEPVHVISTRHLVGEGKQDRVVLTRWQEPENNWEVVVERRSVAWRGAPAGTSALRRQFQVASPPDDLHVSAAVSRDGNWCYMVESRIVTDRIAASCHVYAYNRYGVRWDLVRTFTLTPEDMEEVQNVFPYHVDRDGVIAGHWWIQTSDHSDQDMSANQSFGAPDGGYNYHKIMRRYDILRADRFALTTGQWQDGSHQRIGMTISGTDLVPVERQLVAGGFHFTYYDRRHDWLAGDGYNQNETFYYHYHDAPEYAVIAAGIDLGSNRPTGVVETFTAARQSENDYSNPDYILHTGWAEFYGYTWTDGFVLSIVLPSGWVVRTVTRQRRVLDAARHEWSVELAPGATLDFFPFEHWRLDPDHYTTSDEQHTSVDFPVVVPLPTAALQQTFNAADEESGTGYYGCLIPPAPGSLGPWQIWKNDMLVGALDACLRRGGGDLDSFAGIYWRA